MASSSSSSSSPLPPLPSITTRGKNPLPLIAQRILHSLSTLTSPSTQLPFILSQIIHHKLHLSHPTTIPTSFINSSSNLHLSLRLLSLLPHPTPLLPFNSLLRSLSKFNPNTSSSSSSSLSLSYFLFLQLLHNSHSPNNFTYPPLLSSLPRSPNALPAALSLHSRLLKSSLLPNDPYISNSLLHLYSLLRLLPSSRQLFDEMPHKDVVAWTTMIDALNTARLHADALATFEAMQYAGVRANRVTAICALNACSASGAADVGAWIHEEVVGRGRLKLDVVLGTALVDMYAKCGRVEEGLRVFERMEERNVFTWNAVVRGFALAKSGEEAVEWLSMMEEDGEVRPDEVTLLEVLNVCRHSGLVDVGRKVFDSVLRGKYGFGRGIKHYGCMVDLLARAGLLDEAMQLIGSMLFELTVVMWGSLSS